MFVFQRYIRKDYDWLFWIAIVVLQDPCVSSATFRFVVLLHCPLMVLTPQGSKPIGVDGSKSSSVAPWMADRRVAAFTEIAAAASCLVKLLWF
jgi:hypothetical protein